MMIARSIIDGVGSAANVARRHLHRGQFRNRCDWRCSHDRKWCIRRVRNSSVGRVEIFVRPMRYKGCHQAYNAQVEICALFTTRNSLKLQGRRKVFSPAAKFVPYRKSCAHNQARQPSNPFSCAAPSYVPPSRFPPLEVCVRRPPCAPRHLHGAGIRKPSQERTSKNGR